MSQTLRSFIAVEVPPPVSDLAAAIQDRLQRAGIRGRWVAPENFHVTLRFLGDMAEDRIAGIVNAMESAVIEFEPFSLTVGDIGVFPGKGPPRVIWLGFSEGIGRLEKAHQTLEKALEDTVGIPKEKKSFHGHLTIGRLKDRVRGDRLRKAMDAYRRGGSVSFFVENIVLFESRLLPQGVRYARLKTVPLCGKRTVASGPA